jgi:DNA-binding PadR family transcriptional regulator
VTIRRQTHLPLTTVRLYVLLAVADEALHGYGIIKDVERRTHGAVSLEAGTLYAAIKRLQDAGLLRADEAARRPKDADSRRRYYRLTTLGRTVLRAECDRLEEVLRTAREKRVIPATGRGSHGA